MSSRADFFSDHTVRGRRDYRCTFCRKPIEKASLHVAVASCSGGVLSNYRAHADCYEQASGHQAPAPKAARIEAAVTSARYPNFSCA
jgi:hypothetical protein